MGLALHTQARFFLGANLTESAAFRGKVRGIGSGGTRFWLDYIPTRITVDPDIMTLNSDGKRKSTDVTVHLSCCGRTGKKKSGGIFNRHECNIEISNAAEVNIVRMGMGKFEHLNAPTGLDGPQRLYRICSTSRCLAGTGEP